MSGPHISRGFTGRRREGADPSRIPPGQYLTRDFPVLSAGPTPHTALDQWTFTIDGAVDAPRTWTRKEFLALPHETPTVDIHCVTKWSKLDTSWRGVSVDTLLEEVDTAAGYVTAWCDGGYTTNLALEDVTEGRAWVVHEYDVHELRRQIGDRRAARLCQRARHRRPLPWLHERRDGAGAWHRLLRRLRALPGG